jgi:putative ABC transport system permease protein
MNVARVLIARVRELFGRGRLERELSEELQTHLDMLTDEHVRRGLTRDEARREALRNLGGLEQTREMVRDRRGLPILETLGRDIRFGARLLAKTPGFTLAAVCTLALGIGANTAIFSVVDAVLFQALPYPEPHGLVSIWEVSQKSGEPIPAVAPANYQDYIGRAEAFSSFGGYARSGLNLTGDGNPERVAVEEVTASYFATLGVMPMIGAPFQPEDNQEERSQRVILTHALWQRRFGGQASVLDRAVLLDGRPHRVVGVMPPEFRAASDAGALEPVGAFVPVFFEPSVLANRQEHLINVVGRLKPGISVEAGRANLAAVSEGLAREFPDAATVRTGLAPLGAEQVKSVRPLLVLLLAAVGLVLLIACANVASLVVARSMSRQREMAVRFVLGATRRRVVSELVTQSLLLSAAGAGVGLGLAYWTKQMLVSLAPATFPYIQRAALDMRVLLFAAVLAVVTGVLFGLLPAWQVSRARPVEALRTADRTMAGSWALRNRTALMAVEIALSTLLLVGAGLMLRSLVAVNAVPLGFDPTGVLATSVVLPPQRYATPQARLDFYETLAERVAAIPGVRGVTFSNRLPLRGNWSSGFTFENAAPQPGAAYGQSGAAYGAPGQPQSAGFQAVSPEYFAVFRIPLLRGRLLASSDRSGASGVAVVNAAFVRTFFKDGNPLGQRLRRGPKMPPIEIVGVVGDIRRGGRTSDIEPQLYLPAAQFELYPLSLSDLAVRVDGNAGSYADAVRAAIWSIDPNQPVTNVRTLDEVLSLRIAERHFQTFLFALFAVLALALAVVGVYSVVDYSVRQRTAEIGLRMALGADASGIVRWMVAQSFWIVAGGSVAGLAAAYGLSRYVRTLLFGIEPTDAVTYAGAAMVLATAALFASYLAARRAVRVDPVSALR